MTDTSERLVRMGGEEQRVLTDLEVSGLGKVCLAVSADHTNQYLTGLHQIDPTVISALHSIKFPFAAEVSRPDNVSSITSGVKIAGKFASKRTVNAIFIDNRISFDGNELDAAIKVLFREIAEYETDTDSSRLHNARVNPEFTMPPCYFSVNISHNTDPDRLRHTVTRAGSTRKPVAVVSSSKIANETMHRDGIDPENMTIALARRAVHAGISNLFIAARDAPMLRDEFKDVEGLALFGTGADLELDIPSNHERPALIEDVKDAVDVFVLGSAVLLRADDVQNQLLKFANAIGA